MKAHDYHAYWDAYSIIWNMVGGRPFMFTGKPEDAPIRTGFINWDSKSLWMYDDDRNDGCWCEFRFKSIIPKKEGTIQMDFIQDCFFMPNRIVSSMIYPVNNPFIGQDHSGMVCETETMLESKSPGVTISLGECWYNSGMPLKESSTDSWAIDTEKVEWFNEEVRKKTEL